jgi:hypothetical protein
VDAPGNDGNASMPEQIKRPNPWRKMKKKRKQVMMMMNTATLMKPSSSCNLKRPQYTNGNALKLCNLKLCQLYIKAPLSYILKMAS